MLYNFFFILGVVSMYAWGFFGVLMLANWFVDTALGQKLMGMLFD